MTQLVDQICGRSGLTEASVIKLMRGAPERYKFFYIAKRTGGQRRIAQPAREVKRLQRLVAELVLLNLPVHSAATAYKVGSSIKDNALPHAPNGPILKFDFKEFFPSLKSQDWEVYCSQSGCLAEEEAKLTSTLFFHKAPGRRNLELAIGAPSSPLLSNVLLFEFDRLVSEAVARDHVTYTRYADDLTFSAQRTGYLTGVEKTVRRLLRDLKSPRLYLNSDKTVYATTKFRRSVTGLVLSNDGRVTIGRDRKRVIRAAVHRALSGRLNKEQTLRLCGMLAFVHSVEPEYIDVLKRAYGSEIIGNLQRQIQTGNKIGRSAALDWNELNLLDDTAY